MRGFKFFVAVVVGGLVFVCFSVYSGIAWNLLFVPFVFILILTIIVNLVTYSREVAGKQPVQKIRM